MALTREEFTPSDGLWDLVHAAVLEFAAPSLSQLGALVITEGPGEPGGR
jgi:hypothetical protein